MGTKGEATFHLLRGSAAFCDYYPFLTQSSYLVWSFPDKETGDTAQQSWLTSDVPKIVLSGFGSGRTCGEADGRGSEVLRENLTDEEVKFQDGQEIMQMKKERATAPMGAMVTPAVCRLLNSLVIWDLPRI